MKKVKKGPKRRSVWSTVILFLIMLTGVGIMAYPSVSDYWNSLHQSRAIASYSASVDSLSEETYKKIWDEAVAYNQEFAASPISWEPSEAELKAYYKVLDVSGTGIMGYIEIPKIGCSLPIYHSTDEAVLQVAIGHLVGSSLPVGGQTSHCALSGHRGLPSAKLFTDLDRMVVGDVFYLRVLNETLTYEVDAIHIVEPYDLSFLQLEQGKDLCTLVTCTPYGINTHRLLVRGHRIATVMEEEVTVSITSDALRIPNRITIPAFGIPALFIFLIIMLISSGRRPERDKVFDHDKIGGTHETTEKEDDSNDEQT
ncbi:MAG: class C sortase [Firmicutes bacterium]|nr:class C sortase [Bacillota bacterium]